MSTQFKNHPVAACFASLMIGLLILPGCTSTKMIIPHNDPNSVDYQVNGLQGLRYSQDVEFGPYVANNIFWWWTGEIRNGNSELTMNTYARIFEFTLEQSKDVIWDVRCQLESNRKDFEEILVGVKSGNRSYLKCDMKAADGSGRVASMHLIKSNNRQMAGRIGFGSDMMEVKGSSTGSFLGGKTRTSGYHIRLNQELVSAVDVLKNGAVWFDASISNDHKDLLSASAMALLLHNEIIAMK
ncbi:MAG: hypothetical protein LC662_13455 [Rhodothermaceae bacterium]|nr:hypothetical protein [Rhodothermaceae bacterium]